MVHDDDHMLYATPSPLDSTRRKLLSDFEKVRDKACGKWIAKRKFGAEKHLTDVDRYLKNNSGEFTFYNACAAAVHLCYDDRNQFCEISDIWFWAESKLWPDSTGRLSSLSSFLAGDMALDTAKRYVAGQAVTVYYGNNKTVLQAGEWIVNKMGEEDGSCAEFDPPHFIDFATCTIACFQVKFDRK